MKIELKNIKYSEHLSEETNAFTSNLYVDGKMIGYCRNDGRGGNTEVNWCGGVENRDKFREVVEYCKTLPPHTYEFGGETHSIPMDLEMFVDDLLHKWLLEKETKKREKLMKTCLIWGVPNTGTYTYVNFKRPLTDFPREVLQNYINKYKEKFKVGQVYLNTNLEGFNL